MPDPKADKQAEQDKAMEAFRQARERIKAERVKTTPKPDKES
jgi:hypothetical protein